MKAAYLPGVVGVPGEEDPGVVELPVLEFELPVLLLLPRELEDVLLVLLELVELALRSLLLDVELV